MTQERLDAFGHDVLRIAGYTLYGRSVSLKGGRELQIYFFARGKPKTGRPCALPPGYELARATRTGLPILRRVGENSKEG